MKKKKYIIIIIFVFVIVPIMVVINYIHNELNSVAEFNSELIIEIPKQTTINDLVAIMNSKNLFQPSWVYKYYFKLYATVYFAHIVAGTYKFTPPKTNRELVNSFLSGTNLYIIKVTFPEGITLKKFAEITEKKLNITKETFISFVNSKKIRNKYEIQANTAEGYLMPATYFFYYNSDIETVAGKLLQTQKNLWDTKFKLLAKRKSWTKQKILTLASIIEAETPIASERPIVSGVYHNRLRKGMLLQADPTVQYAVGGKKRLLYRDLRVNNPYNTYMNKGLPPGPINSPSENSINAALNPAKHDYYFFVATGDGSMRHNFAKNIIQHGAYVIQYRRNIRK